jgi:rod shape-determining protein MreC
VVSLQRGGRSRFVLALLLLTAITLATLDARGFGPVESARGAALSVLSPFRSVADWATSPVRSTWNGVWGYRDLEEENARLRAELESLRGQDFREVTASEVLEQILTQNDLTFAGDVPQVLARVIAGPVNNFEETVTIDKGSADGIREGMAAVTGAGLVGRVDRVTTNTAVIRLVTDPRMRVGALLVTSGDQGLVEGRGRGQPPTLEVSGRATIVPGARIQTSGLATSIYPPDVPIGRVVATSAVAPTPTDDAGDADGAEAGTTTTTVATPPGTGVELPPLDTVQTQRFEVELAANLERLSWVTILLWEPAT